MSELSYEASDEASENELLDRSLSVWRGWSSIREDFTPIPLDIHTASSIGQYDCVRTLIARGGVEIDRKNMGGWTPLMYACYIGHDAIVNLLMDAGCNVNLKNQRGQTPLMLAASCGNESVGRFLVRKGAELEAADRNGWTALFHATYSGHQNFVSFLLDQRANMDAVEPSTGMTPFMEAAVEGHEIIVQLFLQHGVNVNAKAYNGDTARTLALMYSYMKIVSLIDNHVMPHSSLRSEPGLGDYLSSSDEIDKRQRPLHQRASRAKSKGPSIRDGPEAIARMIDRTRTSEPVRYPHLVVPRGYMTFPHSGEGEQGETLLSYRDVTSPINQEDYHLDSSGGKDSCDYNDDSNAFSKTGAITIKSSSSSSGGLMAALGLSRQNSADSDEFVLHDSGVHNSSQSDDGDDNDKDNANNVDESDPSAEDEDDDEEGGGGRRGEGRRREGEGRSEGEGRREEGMREGLRGEEGRIGEGRRREGEGRSEEGRREGEGLREGVGSRGERTREGERSEEGGRGRGGEGSREEGGIGEEGRSEERSREGEGLRGGIGLREEGGIGEEGRRGRGGVGLREGGIGEGTRGEGLKEREGGREEGRREREENVEERTGKEKAREEGFSRRSGVVMVGGGTEGEKKNVQQFQGTESSSTENSPKLPALTQKLENRSEETPQHISRKRSNETRATSSEKTQNTSRKEKSETPASSSSSDIAEPPPPPHHHRPIKNAGVTFAGGALTQEPPGGSKNENASPFHVQFGDLIFPDILSQCIGDTSSGGGGGDPTSVNPINSSTVPPELYSENVLLDRNRIFDPAGEATVGGGEFQAGNLPGGLNFGAGGNTQFQPPHPQQRRGSSQARLSRLSVADRGDSSALPQQTTGKDSRHRRRSANSPPSTTTAFHREFGNRGQDLGSGTGRVSCLSDIPTNPGPQAGYPITTSTRNPPPPPSFPSSVVVGEGSDLGDRFLHGNGQVPVAAVAPTCLLPHGYASPLQPPHPHPTPPNSAFAPPARAQQRPLPTSPLAPPRKNSAPEISTTHNNNTQPSTTIPAHPGYQSDVPGQQPATPRMNQQVTPSGSRLVQNLGMFGVGVGVGGGEEEEGSGHRDLAALLDQLGVGKYAALFAEQDVDLQVFLSLTDNDLKEIGIKLFGPRKKMTNAIARWHSQAPAARSSLEQTYADRLEGEMQEMAIQLNQACDNAEKLKAQVLQERQLRSVTEGCLMEERGGWQRVHHSLRDSHQRCRDITDMVNKISSLHSELQQRLASSTPQNNNNLHSLHAAPTTPINSTSSSSSSPSSSSAVTSSSSNLSGDLAALTMEQVSRLCEQYLCEARQQAAALTRSMELVINHPPPLPVPNSSAASTTASTTTTSAASNAAMSANAAAVEFP